MTSLPVGLHESAECRFNLDYSGRLLSNSELKYYNDRGRDLTTAEGQVGAFVTYLTTDSPFKVGYCNLTQLETRTVQLDHTTVTLQHNRLRARNAVDFQKTIVDRDCFLCPEHMDPSEMGIAYDDNTYIFGNKFPYLNGHLVIVNGSHTPQNFDEQLPKALRQAADLRQYCVIYNGPKANATAPDHGHGQAGYKADFPLLNQFVRHRASGAIGSYAFGLASKSEALIPRLLDRTVIAVSDNDPSRLQDGIFEAVDRLTAAPGIMDINFGITSFKWGLTGFIFPRIAARHPEFHKDHGRKISPAAVEQLGLWPVAVATDFHESTVIDRGNDIVEVKYGMTKGDVMDIFSATSPSVNEVAQRIGGIVEIS